MRLVLCDDERILVESLAVALSARGYDVLETATASEDCLRAIDKHRPDVCLLDLYLPGREDGLQTAQAIRENYPETQVLILSGVADPLVLSRAIDLDIAGLLRKDQTVDKIAAALELVAAKEPIFQTSLVRDLVRCLTPKERDTPPQKEPWDYLTEREVEVLRRIAAGQSTKQMASAMRVADNTARTYAQNVLTKLGVHSRLEASAIAVRARLVDETPKEHAG
ncbi:MAG: response regulator [Ktedonobacterales bacterium]